MLNAVTWHSNYYNCAGDHTGQLQIGFCFDIAALAEITPDFEYFTVDCGQLVLASADGAQPSISYFSTNTVPTIGSGSSSTPTGGPDSSALYAASSGGGDSAATSSSGSSSTPMNSSGASSDNPTSHKSGGLSAGAIAGIAIAGTFSAILVGASGLYFNCRTQRREDRRLKNEERRDEIALEERAKKKAEDQASQNSTTSVNQAADNTEAVNPGAHNTPDVHQAAADGAERSNHHGGSQMWSHTPT